MMVRRREAPTLAVARPKGKREAVRWEAGIRPPSPGLRRTRTPITWSRAAGSGVGDFGLVRFAWESHGPSGRLLSTTLSRAQFVKFLSESLGSGNVNVC